MAKWQFYGRSQELDRLREMLARRRWFFCKLSGRRRIGKTALVQQALPLDARNVLYLQVPDSAPSGVVAAFRDALDVFRIDPATLSFTALHASIDVFLKNHPSLQRWKLERIAVAPELGPADRTFIEQQGLIPQDLRDLWEGIYP